jgi:hypothetical protein
VSRKSKTLKKIRSAYTDSEPYACPNKDVKFILETPLILEPRLNLILVISGEYLAIDAAICLVMPGYNTIFLSIELLIPIKLPGGVFFPTKTLKKQEYIKYDKEKRMPEYLLPLAD